MTRSAIKLQGVGKTYRVYDRPIDRLKEALLPFGRTYHQDFHALRDVTFDIVAGSCTGIIGLNGSGKSTLLQCIAGVLTPTSGSVETAGRIAALLELGAGFNGEFSGIENVKFQCAIMGYGAEETAALLPKILEFADIGQFVQHPVKTYSSGMYVRLAFAVAISVDPDILIVDEALAVGDTRFQAKCLSKIREFRAAGKTLLFVSHDAAAVKSLCDHAILLDRGQLIEQGSPAAVYNVYNALIAERDLSSIHHKDRQSLRDRSGSQQVIIQSIEILNHCGESAELFTSGEDVTIRIALLATRPTEDVTVGILIRDRFGRDIFGTNSFQLGKAIQLLRTGEKYICEFSLRLDLGADLYTLTVAAHRGESHVEENFDWINEAVVFKVVFAADKRFSGCVNLHPDFSVRY